MSFSISLFQYWFVVVLVIPSLFLIGIYLTFKLKLIQLRKLHVGIRALFDREREAQGDISNYEAVAAVLAGNLGAGNISGMAIALSTGGPGALFWMWVMAFLGAAFKYCGCFLGVKYRQKDEEGHFVGGPMYYLSKGAKAPLLAALFSLFTIVGAFTVGNMVQIHSMTQPLQGFSLSPMLFSLLMALLVGAVLVREFERFTLIASAVVPVMACFYLIGCGYVIVSHWQNVPEALYMMLQSAFSVGSCLKGGACYAFVHTVSVGFERGIFATDAGVGLAPILQSAARTRGPSEEGIVAMVAPLLVVIVCTITMLMLVVTGAYSHPGLQSTDMCIWAFATAMPAQLAFLMITATIVLFGYTTMLAWAYCMGRAVQYLFGLKWVQPLNWVFILFIPLGAVCDYQIAWLVADLSMSCMLIVNIWGLLKLSREVFIPAER